MRINGGKIQIKESVERPRPYFADRAEAGEHLAKFMDVQADTKAIVLALPRGGVPVGKALSKALAAPMRALVVRKLPIPTSPEMGFGAMALGGKVVLNDAVVDRYEISKDARSKVIDEVQEELLRRAREYNGTEALPDLDGREVYIVDDGLATGYTAMVGALMLRDTDALAVHLAIPVSPVDSLQRVEPWVDEAVCLYAQKRPPFAVASFYRDFHDLSDKEVCEILATQREK